MIEVPRRIQPQQSLVDPPTCWIRPHYVQKQTVRPKSEYKTGAMLLVWKQAVPELPIDLSDPAPALPDCAGHEHPHHALPTDDGHDDLHCPRQQLAPLPDARRGPGAYTRSLFSST